MYESNQKMYRNVHVYSELVSRKNCEMKDKTIKSFSISYRINLLKPLKTSSNLPLMLLFLECYYKSKKKSNRLLHRI